MKKNKKTMDTMKLVIVLLMAAAIAFSALAPIFGAEDDVISVTSAQNSLTREEIREEVSSFMEEVRQMARDFAETPKTVNTLRPVRGLPTGFIFSNQLRERATGDAIRYLQVVLNTDPETKVANSGVGSSGRETNYFGSGTRSALIRFQRKYGLSATGIVDVATRAKINELLQKGVTVKEEATERIEELRLKLMNLAQVMTQLRERIRTLQEQEETEEEVETEE
jgi:murein L,D-transpeptidase YcbB/YkuD